MKLIADYHIHSNNSRFKLGKSSIEEIVGRANVLELKQIAITDHGYKHFFAANKKKLIENRKIIDELNTVYSTKILLGIEADILSKDGTIDVDQETLDMVDILIIGYHKMIKTDFASFFGGQKMSNDAISAATDAYVNAIIRYSPDIVAHPGVDLKLDLYRLGQVCAEHNVLIEINNRHCGYSENEMNDLIRSGCSFVVSSDSYGRESVGSVDKALALIEKYNIPSYRVVNVEFPDNMMSDLEREMEEDYERYIKLLEKQQKSTYDDTLSDETERKLQSIAEEKGIKVKKEDVEIDPLMVLSDEQRKIVKEIQDYIDRHKK